MPVSRRKRWIGPVPVDYAALRALETEFPVHPRVLEVLVRRGLTDPVDVDRFLRPRLEQLHDPFLLGGMKAAAERLTKAVLKGEKIRIFGDYDVDGVTSTVLLLRFFRSLDAFVDYFIPHRIGDGYGLNISAMKEAEQKDISVIVTVDNGIADVEEVAWAQSRGIDVIVTDHHQLPESAPPAFAIVNPHQPGCEFPFKLLAGCGVAFNLAMAVRKLLRDEGFFNVHRPPPNLKELSVYAAIGTIADVVPIVDENRVIVKNGLEVLAQTKSPGLVALREAARINGREITARDVAFGIAPRLNAAGRMASAGDGVELLMTDDPARARELASILDNQNSERRAIESSILTEAVEQVESQGLLDKYRAIVVWKEGWHPGVIGIVASRLVDKYYRPTVVLSLAGGLAKGSCRTISRYNIYEGLKYAHQPHPAASHDPSEGLFESFGGHKYAAGLSLAADRLSLFYDRLDENVRKWTNEEDFIPDLTIDAAVELDEVTPELVHDLERLKPFGVMNEPPVFAVTGARARWPKILKETHLKFRLAGDSGRSIDTIGFGLGEGLNPLELEEKRLEAAGTLELNSYPPDSPVKNVQLRLVDYRFT